MSVTELQAELFGIIVNIPASYGIKLEEEKKEALRVINKLKYYINDYVKYGNTRMTILGYVIELKNQNGNAIENIKALKELEETIKRSGGKIINPKTKYSIYALRPMIMLSYLSMCHFFVCSLYGAYVVPSACMSIFLLFICMQLNRTINKNETVKKGKYTGDEESDCIIRLNCNLKSDGYLLFIPSIALGSAASCSFMIFVVTRSAAQIVMPFMTFGLLISILGLIVSCSIVKNRKILENSFIEQANVEQYDMQEIQVELPTTSPSSPVVYSY
ncbi:hypothetical protein [Wolbachia endosymbiont of Ctenocephalides felis wCfeT]|uniref:hypothetical protein n=1 Tax=Wolbachia endosymbiont of Ctenocephalides felis wCfeT TaxID=2732593 RepID=UPI001444BB18|nr:hypothetical protein [Wolbachia endosymbiont of Ctenocephalides felis wCfeT]